MAYAAVMLSTKPVPSIIASNWFSCMLTRIPWSAVSNCEVNGPVIPRVTPYRP